MAQTIYLMGNIYSGVPSVELPIIVDLISGTVNINQSLGSGSYYGIIQGEADYIHDSITATFDGTTYILPYDTDPNGYAEGYRGYGASFSSSTSMDFSTYPIRIEDDDNQGGWRVYYSSTGSHTVVATANETGKFTDVTDTTASASDVASGKQFYLADGTLETGTATSGGGLVHIASLTPQVVKLSDTDFATWTPSTTAKAILATANVGTFTATDIADHDYYSRVRIYADIQYADGTSTAKGMFTKMVGENWYCLSRRASTNATLNSGTRNANVAESVTNYWAAQYYNSGWIAIYSSSYGIYPSNTAPTLSSASVASPTVTVKRPAIYARCNTTYFATGMASAVDQDASTITFVYDIYRADSMYRRHELHESIIDMWNNGLSAE